MVVLLFDFLLYRTAGLLVGDVGSVRFRVTHTYTHPLQMQLSVRVAEVYIKYSAHMVIVKMAATLTTGENCCFSKFGYKASGQLMLGESECNDRSHRFASGCSSQATFQLVT